MKNKIINKFSKLYYKLGKKITRPITSESIRISYKRKHLTKLQSDLFKHFIESNLDILCCDSWETGVSYTILLSNEDDTRHDELMALFEYISELKLKVKLIPIFNLVDSH